ncbi:MAG: Gldg family protein, partial [Spirochaetota bacterium]
MKRTHVFRRVNLLLLLVILVLVNLVSSNTYSKIDLTRSDAYSLSRVSLETLSRVEDPLRVKVFYSAEVPAPYNSVRQYLLDLLAEYQASENRLFSYEVIDTAGEQARAEAQQYGLRQVDIQEVREDEFQSRTAYMGAVVLYGTVAERVDQLTTTDGLEYRLTTAMRSAITQTDALSGTSEPVVMRVFASPQLDALGIDGFEALEQTMREIHDRINEDNRGRIDFEYLQPGPRDEIEAYAGRFGVEPIRWQMPDGSSGVALLDIVLTHEARTERVPLQILSGLLGGYFLQEPAEIEESIRRAIRSLVSASPRIAYTTGHGEKALSDFQQGAGPFSQFLDQRYEVVTLNPADERIPPDIDTVVVNGPTQPLTEAALYRLDQFVMDGGALLAFVDGFAQQTPPGQTAPGDQPVWRPNETGIERLLAVWGAETSGDLVLDEEAFVARQGGRQQTIFQAPVISGDGVNRDVVITERLEDVIVLNAVEVRPTADVEDVTYRPLLRTSDRSWTVGGPDQITPWLEGAPASADTAARDVAVLLEGTFTSAFDAPVSLPRDRPDDGEAPPDSGQPAQPQTAESFERFRARASQPSRVAVIASSALTTSQMLSAGTSTPNSTFLLNTVDYLNGAPGFAELRSKGLGVARLDDVAPTVRVAMRWTNTILVPLL